MQHTDTYNWSYVVNNPGIYNVGDSNEICLQSEDGIVYLCFLESEHREIANSVVWADKKFTLR